MENGEGRGGRGKEKDKGFENCFPVHTPNPRSYTRKCWLAARATGDEARSNCRKRPTMETESRNVNHPKGREDGQKVKKNPPKDLEMSRIYTSIIIRVCCVQVFVPTSYVFLLCTLAPSTLQRSLD